MRVGYRNKQTVNVDKLTEERKAERAIRNAEAAKSYGERERGVILDKIMKLPEDRRLETLRANGFVDEANALEQELATRRIHELNGNSGVVEQEPLPVEVKDAEQEKESVTEQPVAEVKKARRGRKPKK